MKSNAITASYAQKLIGAIKPTITEGKTNKIMRFKVGEGRVVKRTTNTANGRSVYHLETS